MPSTATCWDRAHLLGLEDLSRADLEALLERAESFVDLARGQGEDLDLLGGRIVANLFFEDSTRTRCSFAVAAMRLGGRCLDLSAPGSSMSKGESLIDTVRTVEAMGVDALVIRASASGAAMTVSKHVRCAVINAGDGRHEHPTQGLADLLTLRQRWGGLAGRRVAVVGDIVNSRVARSNIHGLTTMQADVVLVGPPSLLPDRIADFLEGVDPSDGPRGSLTICRDLDEVLDQVDAVMMLRVQFERGSEIGGDFRHRYGMTSQRAERLRRGAVVMHPGPMNRGLELDSAVADDPDRSVILRQVANGVPVRMAVLATVLAGG
jgi:aspartate carbamoyltransferase catalytic subunit